MLNRIRRAVALTRARHSAKGRHRRALPPARPRAVPATSDAPTIVLERASDNLPYRDPLAGEDIALVRPYVLAWETRVRTRSVLVAPHLPAEVCSALAGVH
ncbi:hypothetical protein [Streptomyces sp. NPDC020362]|uniref:hypothetical protein n=1 Tax=unclassified Streptomyces TaxID=2593676 RepID=UPI0033F5C642